MLRTFSAEDPGSWDHVVDLAVAADAAGLDRVVMSDHVVFGENLDAYADPKKGGARGGKQPTGPDGHWLDPVTTITYLSALTTRLRFGTNILIAALRRPVVLAKELATLDVLSGGRIDLGVGVGWQAEEYEAASYDGEGLSFADIHQMPKPVQPGGVPVWVSGTVNPRSMERLARFGSGWIPWGDDAADVVGGIARMRAAVEALGRNPSDLGIVGNAPMVRDADGNLDLAAAVAGAPELVEAGVTDVRFMVAAPQERAAATDYLSDLVQGFRAAVA
jgi:alkanesulfonate monooxygenase SsuD/methylene tetrahydromethanopterin reductase-like flavin-dependent oxidoreductase (luciferase family)